MSAFVERLQRHKFKVDRRLVDVLQVNIGKRCNLACHHCHVESGPKRTENMEIGTVERILELLAHSSQVHTVDITGGAPELNPHFRHLVTSARKLGKKILNRCNLTVLFEPGQEDTAAFLKDQQVQVVASLPCYSKKNVEKQRGNGVFDKSIEALKILNHLGYGKKNENLQLDLVYNPLGPTLPPSQEKLETDYKNELFALFGIEFNHLYTITNMPIKRFLRDLERSEKLVHYMSLLANSFNPLAASAVMCRSLLSVSWDGKLYDCDFNQMLELPLGAGPQTIWDIESTEELQNKPITFADHCFACTAGSGSSCGGALA